MRRVIRRWSFGLAWISYTRLMTVACICLLPITTLTMVPLFVNYSTSGVFAFTSQDEYEASRWIASHTQVGSYILTDPSSGYIVRGIALRNASTYFILPDGRAPSDSSLLFEDLTLRLHVFFSSQSIVESLQFLQTLPFKDVYIAVTSRTVAWVSTSPETVIYQPVMGANYTSLSSRFSSLGFEESYKSNTVLVYKAVL